MGKHNVICFMNINKWFAWDLFCNTNKSQWLRDIVAMETVPDGRRTVGQPGEPEIRGGSSGDPERVVQVHRRVVLRATRYRGGVRRIPRRI